MAATGVLYLITSGFASNGIGEHSPGGYSLQSAVMIERVPTAFLLIVSQGAVDKKSARGLFTSRYWSGADANPSHHYSGN